VRSINTSLIALLPVAAILFVGAYVLGAGTLKDLSLVLFVGIAASTYSSIFIATPLLADLKEREPAMKALRRRVELRRAAIDAKAAAKSPVAPALDEETQGAVATATIVDPTERRQPQRTSRAQRRPGQGKKRR
jgi:preprotein translocase subunit SecF